MKHSVESILCKVTVIAALGLSASTAWAQSLSPEQRGDCPGAPPASATFPEITAPAHRHDIDLRGTEPATAFRLVAWRVPCPGAVSGGPSRLWLRMSTASFGGKFIRFPQITVVQGGVELGAFSAATKPGEGRQFLITPGAIRVATSALAQSDGPLISGNPGTPFDPAQAVTLYIRPAGWTAQQPDVRIDIPAAGVSGNHGHVPRQIAGQWWNPDRPGWALTLARNERETVFAAWLTYDSAGDTTWFVMPYSESTSDGEIRGAVYAPRSRPFGPLTTPATGLTNTEMGNPVGTFGLRFLDNDRAAFSIDVLGVRRVETIQRLRLQASDGTTCDRSSGVQHDVGIDGWGVGLEGDLTRDNCNTHLTFITFDAERRPVWYFAPMAPSGRTQLVTVQSTFCCYTYTLPIMEGAMYRPRGTPWQMPSSAATQVGPTLGPSVGSAETPKFDTGAGMSFRIGAQQLTILPQPFFFEF
jgi:hypothetical protein